MKILVNVKGASKKTIDKKEYNLESISSESAQMTILEFLSELVKCDVADFNESVNKTTGANPDNGYEYLDKATVLKVLSPEEVEEKAAQGKVAFDVKYNLRLQSEQKAIDNAIQSFKDGIVAVFIDGERYEKVDDVVKLQEGSDVTLVRLTFLAGRMW